MRNVLFYENKYTPPNAAKIEDILKWDDYQLESCHAYIQWLFPLNEKSHFNTAAELLTDEEARIICESAVCSLRVMHAFELMLDFMGLKLNSNDISIYSIQKLRNINNSPHNFLRITRILKSMQRLGIGIYCQPFLNALASAIQKGILYRAKDSFFDYWKPSLQDLTLSRSLLVSLIQTPPKLVFMCSQVLHQHYCKYASLCIRRILQNLNGSSWNTYDWNLKDTWIVIGHDCGGKFSVMNYSSGNLKKTDLSSFSHILLLESTELESPDFPGLYFQDELSEVFLDDVYRSVDSSYVHGQREIQFVLLRRKCT